LINSDTKNKKLDEEAEHLAQLVALASPQLNIVSDFGNDNS